MKTIRLTVFLTFIFTLALSAHARVEEVTEKVEINGADEVVIRCDLGVGTFNITPKEMDEAVLVELSYNPRYFEYSIDSKVKRNKLYVDMDTECTRKNIKDNVDNDWDIYLSNKYPLSLEMDIGACESEFDFGGLQLKELILDIGASSSEIDFSEPNPVRLEEISIDVGASSLDMTNIGNANFDEFSLDGGAGSYDLDFRGGEYIGESIIDIDIGVSSADITLPQGVAVRVEAESDGLFSSIDIHNRHLDEIDDDIWESDDFNSSDNRIILRIDVGMGSIDVRWK